MPAPCRDFSGVRHRARGNNERENSMEDTRSGDQIRMGRLDHQMKMIWQGRRREPASPVCVRHAQAAGLGTHLGEGFDEALAIRLVLEDRLAPVAAIYDACRAEAHSASGW